MATKSKTTSRTYKQKFDELQESIVLFVLSNPAIEHKIISNYTNRNGYGIQYQAEIDEQHNRKYGMKTPDKKSLAFEAERKAEAVKLHKRAQAMNKGR